MQILLWFSKVQLYCDLFFLHCANTCTISDVMHLENGAVAHAFIPSTFALTADDREVSVSMNILGHLTLLEPCQLSKTQSPDAGLDASPPVTVGAVINGLPSVHAALQHEFDGAEATAVNLEKVFWLDILGKPL